MDEARLIQILEAHKKDIITTIEATSTRVVIDAFKMLSLDIVNPKEDSKMIHDLRAALLTIANIKQSHLDAMVKYVTIAIIAAGVTLATMFATTYFKKDPAIVREPTKRLPYSQVTNGDPPN